MSKTNPTDQAGDELDDKPLVDFLIEYGLVHSKHTMDCLHGKYKGNAEEASCIGIAIGERGLVKLKDVLRQHYLPKRDVAEAIGPREPRLAVVCGCDTDPKSGLRLTVEPSITRNNFRAELRHRLGLEQGGEDEKP